MPDIFNRRSDSYGGSFSADGARMLFAMDGLSAETGMLIQQLGVQYQQQVTRLYEVGSNAVYLVGGRTAGTGTLNRVLGPKKLAKAFYLAYGDICNAAKNMLQFEAAAGCNEAFDANVALHCRFVVVNQIGFSLNAGDMMINESMGIMFSSMTYE